MATVGGGARNSAAGQDATVAGGAGNVVNGDFATVGGGLRNHAESSGATVAGGENNSATGADATIPGGNSNQAAGDLSFAAGLRAKANHNGSFVWADDSTHADVGDTGANSFVALASGGFTLYTSSDLTQGVNLPSGSGSWSSLSDRNAKANFSIVHGQALLEKLAALPISTWNYKGQRDSIRHMGPTAQDFRAAFGLGEDDKHISTVDAEGVALAAIQALSQTVADLKRDLGRINRELGERDRRIAELSARLARQDGRP